MSGTKAGGLRAAKTNKERHGKDFYRNIGRKGGQHSHSGGFASNPELARIAGAKGGRISKRGPAKNKKTTEAKSNRPKRVNYVAARPKINPEPKKESIFSKLFRKGDA